MPRLPLRNASAMASGTSASARITLARASCALALFSCSSATAIARRSSALAWAMFLSACAWSICNCAPMFSGVEALFEHHARNGVGIFEHDLMRRGRADRRNDALADTRQHGLLAGAADQLLDVGAHRDAGLCDQLDAVLGHGGHGRRVDHLGVDRHLHGLEHVAARQVDGRRHLEVEHDIGLLGRHEGVHHVRHVAAGQICIPGVNEFGDDLDIVVNKAGSGLHHIRTLDVQLPAVLEKRVGVILGDLHDGLVLTLGALEHLILALIGIRGQVSHVGDVHDAVHVVSGVAQVFLQHVLHDIGAQVADVGKVVHRGAAGVHLHMAGGVGLELLFLVGGGIIQIHNGSPSIYIILLCRTKTPPMP